jgi:hypothetical protein
MGICQMAIEIFRLPKRGAHGIYIYLKESHPPPPAPPPTLLGDKKFQSQYNGGGVSNGNQIF